MTETMFHRDAVRELPSRDETTSMSSTQIQETGQILLLGEDNPQSAHPAHALVNYPDGCAGHRLQSRVLEIVPEIYHAIWRTNLCGRHGWDVHEARGRFADLILSDDVPWRTVVVLGRKVASIFEEHGIVRGTTLPPFEFAALGTEYRALDVVCLPHPSGRCREWNDPRSYGRAHALMRRVSAMIPWGGAML